MSAKIRRRTSPGYTAAGCDSCGGRCYADPDKRSLHTAWARRHVEKNSGHVVFVATEKTTIYEGS
jgi:hypothetical protein